MSRKALHQLLQQYLNGTCTPAEKDIIERWYDLLNSNISLSQISREELQEIEDRLWEKVSAGTIEKRPEKKLYGRVVWISSAAAACLALFFLINSYLEKPYSVPQNAGFVIDDTSEYIVQENTSNKIVAIKLEDNSEVFLKPFSVLTYPKKFAAKERKVFLTGEAFFKISKNPERPFYLYNINTIVKVLGTSFNVIANEETKVTEVAVSTGKVMVAENDQNVTNESAAANEVVLTPNQKVIYDSKKGKFEKKLVDVPLPVFSPKSTVLNKTPGVFVLSETPLKNILNLLEQMYGIEILVENDELNDCKITGDISSENLYDKLDIICQSLESTYLIDGTKIYINGKGCK